MKLNVLRRPSQASGTATGRLSRRRQLPIVAASIAVLPGGALTPGAASATSSTADCATAIIAARGTNAPGGLFPRNGRVWEGGGFGPVLARLIKRYAESSLTVNAVGLIFPAAGGLDYPASVTKGVDNLVAEVNWLAGTCSVGHRIILIGHSQGAQIILDAISSGRMTSAALRRIKAVAVFGDPTYQPNRPYNAGDKTAKGVFTRGYQSMLFLDAYKTSGGAQKIRFVCYDGDAFCDRGLSSDAISIHSSYLNSSTRVSASYNWINGMP